MASEFIDPVTLVAEALLSADRIGHVVVIVEDLEGTITLKGTVESEQDRAAVEAIAQEQEGVVEVINRLKII